MYRLLYEWSSNNRSFHEALRPSEITRLLCGSRVQITGLSDIVQFFLFNNDTIHKLKNRTLNVFDIVQSCFTIGYDSAFCVLTLTYDTLFTEKNDFYYEMHCLVDKIMFNHCKWIYLMNQKCTNLYDTNYELIKSNYWYHMEQ